MIGITKGNIEYDKFLVAAHKTDAHLAKFIEEKLPRDQFLQAVRITKKVKPGLFRRIQGCVEAAEAGHEERIRTAKTKGAHFFKQEFWSVAQEFYKTYSCEAGFTADKSVRKTVTISIRGDRPKKAWSPELLHLQDKLVNKVDSERKWTFSFDNRTFIANLNQEEIDILRKDNSVYRIVEEPEAHILWGEYAPYPAYTPGAENTDWGVSKINASYAWAKGFKGQGVKVAVIDSGIDYNHVDLVDRYKGGYNFVAVNDNPMDDHMHGTHCCGIVGASDNGLGYKGVAPEVDLYAVKVLNAKGSGSFGDIAAGIDWCVINGMDIISMSLGGVAACSGATEAACINAWNYGLVVVAAAGNEGENCPEEGCVIMPGNCTAVIAVGSIDKDEYRSLYSSYGPEVELTAPGEGITSCWLVGHDPYGDGLNIVGDYWFSASGTSMACPHVAGACALIKSWYPDATNYEIRQWLRDNAVDL